MDGENKMTKTNFVLHIFPLVINGAPNLFRTADQISSSEKYGMNCFAVAGISSSEYTKNCR